MHLGRTPSPRHPARPTPPAAFCAVTPLAQPSRSVGLDEEPSRSRAATALWPDRPPRRLVGAAGGDLHHPRELRRLRHLGRVPERVLPLGPVPVALLLARTVRRLAARVVRAQARLVAGAAAVQPGAAHPPLSRALPLYLLLLPRRVLQGVLGRPAQLRRGRAAQGLPGRALDAARAAERPPLFPLRRADLHLPAGLGRHQGHAVRRRLRHRRGDHRPDGQRRPAVRLHAGLPLAAPPRRRGHRPAVQAPRALRVLRGVQQAQPRPHEVGVGVASSAWRSATSTCGCAPWGSGPTGGSSDGGFVRDGGARRAGDRRGRGRAAGGHRGRGGGGARGPRLQVAAGQGAHGDGRRRRRRRHGQRGRARQLEGALRRYPARRAVPEQLADGGAARPRGPGPGARAGGVGRPLRPHAGRAHPAAQLRRAPLPAPGARGRPHGAGDDPHPAGPRHPSGDGRAHGGHRRSPC